MNAKESLDRGQLTDAIRALNEEIKANPTDLELRTILFQFHCYAGDLVRAEKQLDVIRTKSTEIAYINGLRVYQGLLNAERARTQLFEHGERPRFLVAPPESVTLHLDALDQVRAGRFDDARALLERAATTQEAIRGSADGVEFDDFRDADDILSPVLEVFSTTGYYWVPWGHVQFLEVPKPKTLLDLLWAPAKLATYDGQLGEVYLPSLYPGTSASPDGPLRLGRQTDWVDVGAGIIRGIGRKSLLVGEDVRTLQELGQAQFPLTEGKTSESASESSSVGRPGDES
ncbi:type VI secretion system accessory protein TagJ [Singulisphaera acidiphila]|uniref:Protein of avirulence locus involved in temperature-dependent protein secretion n=1 Tax=Singulisphaera acidiphila (strain ATCC BAA-1392 / DSM 18658 / VKM B-2454 / MOB10) TaxID=886293 RepID=L0DBG9_SINAD|nr:type VI secretion system accessory protein TagJ [Singulisphaera acidiphila]AGA26724.1 protein of avirulence locus involved in temperature-dependent protein secretion [Singulisphaera acidiphila DSM 18658]